MELETIILLSKNNIQKLKQNPWLILKGFLLFAQGDEALKWDSRGVVAKSAQFTMVENSWK